MVLNTLSVTSVEDARFMLKLMRMLHTPHMPIFSCIIQNGSMLLAQLVNTSVDNAQFRSVGL